MPPQTRSQLVLFSSPPCAASVGRARGEFRTLAAVSRLYAAMSLSSCKWNTSSDTIDRILEAAGAAGERGEPSVEEDEPDPLLGVLGTLVETTSEPTRRITLVMASLAMSWIARRVGLSSRDGGW